MPTIRKTARSLFAVALLAAGFSVTAPMNAAYAMNQTPCTTERFSSCGSWVMAAGGRGAVTRQGSWS
ncbi:hypothetical protein, partial [Streptomyces barkulensis]|uniref:hypothetical protein n=1 Tax=Streptomyces barkulensis TaxID=1257026 RepID=UPI0019D2D637